MEILITGSWPGPRRFAGVGGRRFRREPHETLEMFRARVRAVAVADGARFFVVGCLPKQGENDDWPSTRYAGPDEKFELPPKPAPHVLGIDD
jgi:hypothetical protein